MNIERKTIENDEEYLRQVSEDVDFKIDPYKNYIKVLEDYCKNNAVFALAPVQIGIPKRLIYIKNSSQNMEKNSNKDYDENIIYINPKILSSSGETEFLEGCYSCATTKNNETIYYTCVVKRPYKMEIEYFNIMGKKERKIIKGFESTVFSHEYDHLDGILHIDKSKEVYKMTLEEMKDYRDKHPYKIISKE